MTDISKMHPADLIAAWRTRPAHQLFRLASGHASASYQRQELIWTWRASGSPVRSSSKVHAHRNVRGVHVYTSDEVPGRTTRVKSHSVPLVSWAQLEQLVSMLVDGDPMVPRIQESPCACGGPAALVSYGGGVMDGPIRRICADCTGTDPAVRGGL